MGTLHNTIAPYQWSCKLRAKEMEKSAAVWPHVAREGLLL